MRTKRKITVVYCIDITCVRKGKGRLLMAPNEQTCFMTFERRGLFSDFNFFFLIISMGRNLLQLRWTIFWLEGGGEMRTKRKIVLVYCTDLTCVQGGRGI